MTCFDPLAETIFSNSLLKITKLSMIMPKNSVLVFSVGLTANTFPTTVETCGDKRKKWQSDQT